jgi:hypothetical protein
MTDAESSRMHHLMHSTNVFLYNIDTEQMLPVLITDTSVEHKTFKGQGNKLVNYTINVEFANKKMRR